MRTSGSGKWENVRNSTTFSDLPLLHSHSVEHRSRVESWKWNCCSLTTFMSRRGTIQSYLYFMIFLFHFVQLMMLHTWTMMLYSSFMIQRYVGMTAKVGFANSCILFSRTEQYIFQRYLPQHHLAKTGPTATVFSSFIFIFSFEEHNTKREDLEIRVPSHQEIHILTAPPCPLPSAIETVLPLSCWGRETTCNLRRFLEMRWQTSLLLLIWDYSFSPNLELVDASHKMEEITVFSWGQFLDWYLFAWGHFGPCFIQWGAFLSI